MLRSLHGIEPTYRVTAGIDGEVFPALANYASLQRPKERQFGTFTVTVTNSSDSPLSARISVQVPGWSDVELQNVTIGSGEVRKLFFAPAFLPRLYANHEIAAATAVVHVTDRLARQSTPRPFPSVSRSVDDIYWGPDFKFAPFIASWVTPARSAALKRFFQAPRNSCPDAVSPATKSGNPPTSSVLTTLARSRAIYRALQETGVQLREEFAHLWPQYRHLRARSHARRIAPRAPPTALTASYSTPRSSRIWAWTPIVVLVPGHAYVGVRDAHDSSIPTFISRPPSLAAPPLKPLLKPPPAALPGMRTKT